MQSMNVLLNTRVVYIMIQRYDVGGPRIGLLSVYRVCACSQVH